ncbi:histidine phosphatase family protein [bacterium]|nr:MAG: histidine phosphatase family protein [bacterium]
MKMLLIRHGQTPSNLTGAIDTVPPGAPLTALGIAQASALGPALMHEGLAAVYSSPLLRARSTAEILAQHLGLETLIHPGLVEISGGDLEMRADDEATQRYVECMLRWMNRDLSFKIPGGVTGNTFLDTYSAALTSRSGAAGTRSGRRGHPRSVHARFSCASCRVWG